MSATQTPHSNSPCTDQDLQSMWQYRLHQENVFYQRVSQFLIAESMLVMAYTTVLPKVSELGPGAAMVSGHGPVAYLLILFGVALTLLWWKANCRQRYIMRLAANRVATACGWYATHGKSQKKVLLGTGVIMTHLLPALVLILWLSLAAVLYFRVEVPVQTPLPPNWNFL